MTGLYELFTACDKQAMHEICIHIYILYIYSRRRREEEGDKKKGRKE